MIQNCCNHRIYVDVVFNHMAAGNQHHAVGTARSYADPSDLNFPDVPFTKENFHSPPCGIDNWKDAHQVTATVSYCLSLDYKFRTSLGCL